jgi:hypothetical protein
MPELDYTKHDELVREITRLVEVLNQRGLHNSPINLAERIESRVADERVKAEIGIVEAKLEVERKRLTAEALLDSEAQRLSDIDTPKNKGGRPSISVPCGWCQKPYPVAKIRPHFTICPKRPR